MGRPERRGLEPGVLQRERALDVRGHGRRARRVDPAQVAVAATFVPEGAVQVAVVETHGNIGEGIEALMTGFRTEVGARGGNFGKVDSMRTRFEMQEQTSLQSYSCGTPTAPQTCSRMVTHHVEVGITTVMGRAFRVGGVQ